MTTRQTAEHADCVVMVSETTLRLFAPGQAQASCEAGNTTSPTPSSGAQRRSTPPIPMHQPLFVVLVLSLSVSVCPHPACPALAAGRGRGPSTDTEGGPQNLDGHPDQRSQAAKGAAESHPSRLLNPCRASFSKRWQQDVLTVPLLPLPFPSPQNRLSPVECARWCAGDIAAP